MKSALTVVVLLSGCGVFCNGPLEDFCRDNECHELAFYEPHSVPDDGDCRSRQIQILTCDDETRRVVFPGFEGSAHTFTMEGTLVGVRQSSDVPYQCGSYNREFGSVAGCSNPTTELRCLE